MLQRQINYNKTVQNSMPQRVRCEFSAVFHVQPPLNEPAVIISQINMNGKNGCQVAIIGCPDNLM